jgi:thioredoxin reductase (NADPH)
MQKPDLVKETQDKERQRFGQNVYSARGCSVDYDAIIVGGGPAGLSAGTHLSQAKYRVLLLDKESFGGQIMNVEWIGDFPGSAAPVSGAVLASGMVNEAAKCGVHMELGEVVEIESYSGCKSVRCADGRAYTSAVVIVAGGLRPKKLGVPGEDRLQGKGMIHCTMCDAGLYAGEAVAVCGGGYAGLIEAMYLANHASKVHLIEAQPGLTAPAHLQQRAHANTRLDIRCAATVVEIVGDDVVTGVQVQDAATGSKELLNVSGVLVRVGFDPATDYLEGTLSLDERGGVVVDDRSETDVAGIMAAGDIRSESPRSVAAAVSDGKTAAMSAQRFLDAA